MLFFQFNKDNFAISKNESCEFDFGQVQNFFLEKFKDELCLDRIEKTSVFYDILGIPIDAFSIDDEALCNLDGVLKFALSEYVKLPIKELNNKSLSDLGIQIEFCKRESNKIIDMKIERYMKENNSRYLNEDILWKNMNYKEKIYKFLDKLIKIESKNNELIIVDPFIFSDDDDGYCNMLNCILNESKAKNIIIVTKENDFKESSFLKISEPIRQIIDKKYSNYFHDRFWIANRKKGFYTGTSLNGVGKKISLINTLSDYDIAEIISELRKYSLIS